MTVDTYNQFIRLFGHEAIQEKNILKLTSLYF